MSKGNMQANEKMAYSKILVKVQFSSYMLSNYSTFVVHSLHSD
jgi:hypothetical protein